jgi:hypothetical protein
MGVSTRKGLCSWFKLGKVDPSFKDFLAFPAHILFLSFKDFLASLKLMPLGLVSIKPDMGHAKSFPVCNFLRVMPVRFFRLVLFSRVVFLMC